MRLSTAFLLSTFIASATGFVSTTTTRTTRSSFITTPKFTSSTARNVLADNTSSSSTVGKPGTAELDTPWEDLGFEFRPTKSNLRITYKDGEWGEMELCEDPNISIHMGATALHYGQACFEGLKAFAHEDDSVHVFRPDQNAKRLQSSCERTLMPTLPHDIFLKAVNAVVKDNIEYVPPYGTGGALYLRPLLFGSGPRIGLSPADEYTFVLMVMPVADYYKGGLNKPVDGLIITDYDRAAPRGVGNVKVAGNYAADMLPNMLSKAKGFPISLYLDAKTQTLVEEFSTSNFVGIDNEKKTYVTPVSGSVLPSITNKSLMTIAKDEGLTVEERDIPIEEMESFDEVLAVGTAVVVTPIGSVTMLGEEEDGSDEKKYQFGSSEEIGATTRRLYDRVRAIQYGEEEDKYGWNLKIE
jgi:branched-chain amino acid aminotransferase